jgi:hypothetical protein
MITRTIPKSKYCRAIFTPLRIQGTDHQWRLNAAQITIGMNAYKQPQPPKSHYTKQVNVPLTHQSEKSSHDTDTKTPKLTSLPHKKATLPKRVVS